MWAWSVGRGRRRSRDRGRWSFLCSSKWVRGSAGEVEAGAAGAARSDPDADRGCDDSTHRDDGDGLCDAGLGCGCGM